MKNITKRNVYFARPRIDFVEQVNAQEIEPDTMENQTGWGSFWLPSTSKVVVQRMNGELDRTACLFGLYCG